MDVPVTHIDKRVAFRLLHIHFPLFRGSDAGGLLTLVIPFILNIAHQNSASLSFKWTWSSGKIAVLLSHPCFKSLLFSPHVILVQNVTSFGGGGSITLASVVWWPHFLIHNNNYWKPCFALITASQ